MDNQNLMRNSNEKQDFKKVCIIPESEYNDMYDRAAIQKSVRWPLFYTIKIKFLNGQEWQHAWIKKIVDEQIAPLIYPNLFIKFVKNDEYADVKIEFMYNGIYGASLIGTKCRDTPQNKPSMIFNGNALDTPLSGFFEYNSKIYQVPKSANESDDPNGNGAVIKHEFGHVFGKWHEHQNPIDNPIKWNVSKVLKKYMSQPPPPYWTRQETYNNIINKLSMNDVDATPFDAQSIMMYPIDASITKNNVGFDKTYDYSPMDIEWLKYHSVDPQLDVTSFGQNDGSTGFGFKWWYIFLVAIIIITIFLLVKFFRRK